jgi:hypothetical protein
MNCRIHMAVEAKAAPVARSRQRCNDVGTIREEPDFAGVKALASQPIMNVLGHRTLAARWTVDIGEIESNFHQLIGIDVVQHGLGIYRHRRSFAVGWMVSEMGALM